MYRFNEIAQSGALLTFASDVVTSYELHRADPILGMQIAHTRVDPEYPLDPSVYPRSMRPEESARLSRETLLAGYTINAARQLRQDNKLGSIENGKIANLAILSDDPLSGGWRPPRLDHRRCSLVRGSLGARLVVATAERPGSVAVWWRVPGRYRLTPAAVD